MSTKMCTTSWLACDVVCGGMCRTCLELFDGYFDARVGILWMDGWNCGVTWDGAWCNMGRCLAWDWCFQVNVWSYWDNILNKTMLYRKQHNTLQTKQSQLAKLKKHVYKGVKSKQRICVQCMWRKFYLQHSTHIYRFLYHACSVGQRTHGPLIILQ